MEQFRQWYTKNYEPITWFLIGFLVASALTEFSRGNTGMALVEIGIAVINYVFVKRF